MKRRLLALALLTMLLGTSGAVFAQSQYAAEEQQIIASVQEFVKSKGESHISVLRQSDIIDMLLALLAEALLIGGLFAVITRYRNSYIFNYTQAASYFTPDKEKNLRFAWDDLL